MCLGLVGLVCEWLGGWDAWMGGWVGGCDG